MKKSLLHIAIATFSLIALPSFADVVVYGKANVSLQQADENSNDKTEVVSNASRIGIKGSEVISGGLKAIYQFEYQTEVDDGTTASNQTFSQRNIYVGLQGSGGTIIAGHFDTPTKAVQEKIDLFNDLEGDIVNILRGEIRSKNIVQYTTPGSWGGFATSVAFVGKETDGVDDGYSAAVSYTSPAFYVGIAMDQDVEAVDVDLLRAALRVTLGPVQLGALAEEYDNGVSDKETGYLGSILWNITPNWAAKIQYGQSDVKMLDGETASIGLDYKLSANMTLFSYYTTVENDVLVELANPRDDKYAGIGFDLKF